MGDNEALIGPATVVTRHVLEQTSVVIGLHWSHTPEDLLVGEFEDMARVLYNKLQTMESDRNDSLLIQVRVEVLGKPTKENDDV